MAQWREEDHPRDEEGKFTFAQGGNEEPLKGRISNIETTKPENILYGGTIAKEKFEHANKVYKNVLLDTLGSIATPAMILYSSAKKLEDEVKKYGLEDKLNEKILKLDNKRKEAVDWVLNKGKNVVKEWIYNRKIEENANDIGENYNKLYNSASKIFFGEDAAGMLDISHNKPNDNSYLEGVYEIKNYKDKKFEKYQSYLKNKISEQFKHYGTNIESVKGYYFPPNTKASKNIANDYYTQEFVKNNKNGFLNHNLEKTSINYKTGNMYYAHHLVDVVDYGFNSEGNLEIIIADTNDYNQNDPNKLVQAGDIAMKNKKLEPRFVLKHIVIPKDILEKLWGKDYN